MSILVDTNILLRRAQVVSQFHRVSLDSLTELVRARVTLCLVPQVIYELWAAVTRPVGVNGLGMDVPAAERSVKELFRDFVLLRDERGVFNNWQRLVVDYAVRGKHSHDARLRLTLRGRHGLDVPVHRDADVSVTQQRLRCRNIRALAFHQSAERVTQRVPA